MRGNKERAAGRPGGERGSQVTYNPKLGYCRLIIYGKVRFGGEGETVGGELLPSVSVTARMCSWGERGDGIVAASHTAAAGVMAWQSLGVSEAS